MTQRRFQALMAIAIVVFHIGVFALATVLWMSGLGAQEFVTTLAVVTPFLAAFMTLAINNVVENMNERDDKSSKLSTVFVFVASVVPAAFAAALVIVIIMKYRGLLAPTEFAGALGAVESALGVYAGILLRSLFGVAATPAAGAAQPVENS